MRKLERLTAALLAKAERKGKTLGWYNLAVAGYLPAEIALYAEPTIGANDVTCRVRDYANLHGLPVPVTCAPKRERRFSIPPNDWRAAFRSNVMRVGMHLSLSQPMMEYLCAVADGVTWDRSLICGSSQARPGCDIATSTSLEKRGLIRRRPDFKPNPYGHESVYELTDAGKAVVDLLKSVGVFLEADAAIVSKAGK